MRHRPLLIVLATVFIALIGFGIVIPLIPVYAERFGASGTEVGLLATVYSLVQFLFAPVLGRLSDRIGRRPVIITCLLITAGSYVIFGFAQNLTMLFISRILGGIGGADITVAQAYIADVTPPEKRARGMGLFGAAFGVGFTLGPALTALSVTIAEWLPAFIAASLAGGTALFALGWLPEPEKHSEHAARSLKPKQKLDRSLLTVMVLYFATVYAQSTLWSIQVLFTVEIFGWRELENGLFLGAMGLWSAGVQSMFIGVLAKRLGERWLIRMGLLFMGTGLLLINRSGTLMIFLLGNLVEMTGFAIANPALSTLASKQAPENQQGAALGVFQSMGSMGRITGPLTSGVVWDLISPRAPFGVGSGLAFITSVAAMFFLSARRWKPKENEIRPEGDR